MKHILPAIALAVFALTSCAQTNPPPAASKNLAVSPGRALFLKNCAHCHGADASGDEGPDLHKFDWTDDQIAKRIRNGKAGQMTAFAGKLTPEQINTLVTYVRTLK